MEKVAKEVYTNGCTYTLVKRGEKACIYIGRGRYEVFLIKTRPKENITGKDYPAREAYPSTSDWGISAWTYIKLENAEKAFEELEHNKPYKKIVS